MEEDHEELLQYSDDESVSEVEDHCCSVEKSEDRRLLPLTFFAHSASEFYVALVALILSSGALMVVLPLYISAVNVRGNVYSLIVFNVPLILILLCVIMIVLKFTYNKFRNLKVSTMPIKFSKLFQLAGLYLSACYAYLYANDQNRVMCHLQDPVKAVILGFALLYYFFFCRKLMGLNRIFSTTTIIVGLFVTVDYGMCNEFTCRGYDRQQVSDDAGLWSWHTHTIWMCVYIMSLILFPAFFTLFDHQVAPKYEMPSNIVSPSFLSTISRSVTGNSSQVDEPLQQQVSREEPIRKSAVHLALWLHIFIAALMVATFWIDFIPGIGKANSIDEFTNYTMQGLKCHVNPNHHDCTNVFWYSIAFQMSYQIFTISSIKFLILSQSAVFTIASMCSVLPVVGVWWSVFAASPSGELLWSPKLRGEFFCSVIGLPIVFVGLGLLCKAHFEDIRKPRNVMAASRS